LKDGFEYLDRVVELFLNVDGVMKKKQHQNMGVDQRVEDHKVSK